MKLIKKLTKGLLERATVPFKILISPKLYLLNESVTNKITTSTMKKETCNLPFKLQLKSLLFFVVSVRWIPMRREREAQNAEGKCEQGF